MRMDEFLNEAKKIFVKHDDFFVTLPSNEQTEKKKGEIFDRMHQRFQERDAYSVKRIFRSFGLSYDEDYCENENLEEDFLWQWLCGCIENCESNISLGITDAMMDAKMQFMEDHFDEDDSDLYDWAQEHCYC